MAVAEILEEYNPPVAAQRMAWKAFNVGPSGLIQFPHYSLRGTFMTRAKNRPVPRGKWLKAVKQDAPYNNGRYTTGFHVVPTLSDLDKWGVHPGRVFVRVLVRKIRLLATHTPEGRHNSPLRLRLWIADEMYVPEIDEGDTR